MKKKLSFYLISVSMFFGSLTDSGNRELPSKEDSRSLTERIPAKSKWLGIQWVQVLAKDSIPLDTYEPLGVLAKKKTLEKKILEKKILDQKKLGQESYHASWKHSASDLRKIAGEWLLLSVVSGYQLVYKAIGKTWTDTRVSLLTRFGFGTAKKRFLALVQGSLYQKDDPLAELNTSKQI